MDHYGTMALVGTTREPVSARRVKEYIPRLDVQVQYNSEFPVYSFPYS
jgi:hypothetical protein